MTRRRHDVESAGNVLPSGAGDLPVGSFEGEGDTVESLREMNRRLLDALAAERERVRAISDRLVCWHDLLINLGEGVIVVDADDRVMVMSLAVRSLLGLRLKAGTPVSRLLESLDVRYLDDRPVPLEQHPISRVQRGERYDDYELVVHGSDGSRHYLCFSGNAVRDPNGELVVAIVVYHDVTRLRLLEKLKEEYVSLVSHDLRAPLTIVIGRSDLLRRRLAGQGCAEDTQSVEAIRRSALRMETMIQDMAESARLETGRIEMHRSPTDLVELIRNLVDGLVPIEERYRIHIHAERSPMVVPLDRARIERVVTNLLTNALKYSPSNRAVTIDVRSVDREVVVAISDHGPGIPPDELSRIFQKYYRTSGARTGAGLGLGLYIARLIVEASGGRIWATSKLGEGSTFTFSLPMI